MVRASFSLARIQWGEGAGFFEKWVGMEQMWASGEQVMLAFPETFGKYNVFCFVGGAYFGKSDVYNRPPRNSCLFNYRFCVVSK